MDPDQFGRMVRRLLQMAGYALIHAFDFAGDAVIYVEIDGKIIRGHVTPVGLEIHRVLLDGLYRYGRIVDIDEVIPAMQRAARPLHEVRVWDSGIREYVWVSRTYDVIQAHREALACGRARVVIL